MTKQILTIFLSIFLFSGTPLLAHATAAVEIIENEPEQQVGIYVSGTSLRVTGAEGQTLQVYNVAGVRVFTAKVDSDDKRYDLNLRKGCYIVKVGKTVRKISIR